MKLKVVVMEGVPRGKIYIANEAAAGLLSKTPFDELKEILDPKRTVICGTDKQADEIRRAAKQIGAVELVD